MRTARSIASAWPVLCLPTQPSAQTLEAIVHPYIGQRILEEIAEARRRVRLVVLDAAIMLEVGWHRVCDHLVFIESPREIRIERLKVQRGWSVHQIEEREQAQMPLAEKRRHADAVIDNSTDADAVAGQVQSLLERWGV